jgi:hypothetical protein
LQFAEGVVKRTVGWLYQVIMKEKGSGNRATVASKQAEAAFLAR